MIEKIGWLVFLVGFIIGAIGSIPSYDQSIPIWGSFSVVAWLVVTCGSILGVFGVIWIHIGYRQRFDSASAKSTDASSTADGEIDPRHSLETIIGKLEKIDADSNIQQSLEDIQMHDILPVAEYRNFLARKMGLAKFALMFSDFANGERYVNRAWSAIVDEHTAECVKSIKVATTSFKNALQHFN